MKKKIKDLTVKELISKKCSYKGNDYCGECPFRVYYNYGCSLHDLVSSITNAALEKEVEVDE